MREHCEDCRRAVSAKGRGRHRTVRRLSIDSYRSTEYHRSLSSRSAARKPRRSSRVSAPRNCRPRSSKSPAGSSSPWTVPRSWATCGFHQETTWRLCCTTGRANIRSVSTSSTGSASSGEPRGRNRSKSPITSRKEVSKHAQGSQLGSR